ncbi:hypothetical protein OK015_28720 (plasmid) [Mycobacterium sp. Aquia_216]|uniref:hypothetical protein n=1 Tax=Mycobacterium sp. Aquia_216 TaxID=2991729 RepID=UPI00227B2771|nr:hypothetical protein [Mycobacterium sp. Aquia_216]WAJ48034.1 hypothetical protein OK015_28720 [Mycobacterium sp. Aquia_216]
MPSAAPTPQRPLPLPPHANAFDTTSGVSGHGQRKDHGDWLSHYIDSEPVRNHITRLRVAGMEIKHIARSCGISPGAIELIVDRRTGAAVKVLRSTAAKILAVTAPSATDDVPVATRPASALGTRRRVRALVAAGYTPSMLSHELGITPKNTYTLFSHCDEVPAAIAHAVADLFDRLEMTPGPSDRARILAHKLRWAPPLAWDEDSIDDPNSDPAPAATKPPTFAERYRELRELGVHDELAIARRLGMKVDSLQRQLARYRQQVAL